MMHFLNLIRWKNLLLIIIVQVLIKYALFNSFKADTTLSDLQLILLLVATVSIAAAGNIINDIYDIETDTVNKPDQVIVGKHISEKVSFNLFIAFNIVGVGLGFYLANNINRSGFATLFVIISALLYVYSTYLKYLVLVGNFVVSALIASSILIVGLFDLLPTINTANRELHLGIFQILLVYAAFAFVLNLIREIVKDIEDINGDHKAGMKTLPIVIGRERATMVVFAISLLPVFGMIYLIIESIYKYQLALICLLLFVVGPMIYISIKLFSAERKSEYQHIATMLKMVMLFGVLSLLLYPLVINNAY